MMKRLMGLDLGDKTIGVAVSDPMGWTAQGVTVIRRVSHERDFQALRQVIDEYEIHEIVLGFPKNMDGTVGERGKLSLAYAERIKGTLGLPVVLWDERLTTVAATRTLLEADVSRAKRKQVVDKMAAALLLQTYMDSKAKG
jgi:putative Holliday junction resolvase